MRRAVAKSSSPRGMIGRVSPAARLHHRYSALLGLILLLLAFQLAAPDEPAARFVSVLLQAVVLIAAVVVSRVHRWVARVTALTCALVIAGSLGALLGSDELAADSGRVISFMLVALTPPVIVSGLVKHFREQHAITREAMFGVLCIYLLLGMLFSASFAVAQALSGDAFFASGPGETSDFLYFSYTTLTTTGYGDLVAATGLGRSLAITEALIGQIYLVTVVAVIVGNLGRVVEPDA